MRHEERLVGVHSGLAHILREVDKVIPITIIEGIRSIERQEQLMAEGKSLTKDAASGKHISGHAVDCAPQVFDWTRPNSRDNLKSFYVMYGAIRAVAMMLDIKVRCGADWDGDFDFTDQKFHDLPHVEIILP